MPGKDNEELNDIDELEDDDVEPEDIDEADFDDPEELDDDQALASDVDAEYEDEYEDEDDDDEGGEDEEDHDEETAEALEELENEELALLDDEAADALLVDEAKEIRAIRREELTLDVDAQSQRSDEFVCQSCFLVKRTSQLANRRKMYCTDCAD